MKVLIGNIVKTDFGDYPCATREEAEALFMTLRDPAEKRESGPVQPKRKAAAKERPD